MSKNKFKTFNEKKIYLCSKSEIYKKKYLNFWIDEWKDELIIFVDKSGQIKSLSSICPHFGGPIGYHEIKIKDDKPVFTCLWHNLQYFVETGQCVTQKKFCLRKYEIEIVKEEIFVYIN